MLDMDNPMTVWRTKNDNWTLTIGGDFVVNLFGSEASNLNFEEDSVSPKPIKALSYPWILWVCLGQTYGRIHSHEKGLVDVIPRAAIITQPIIYSHDPAAASISDGQLVRISLACLVGWLTKICSSMRFSISIHPLTVNSGWVGSGGKRIKFWGSIWFDSFWEKKKDSFRGTKRTTTPYFHTLLSNGYGRLEVVDRYPQLDLICWDFIRF